jgi:hypothetical protein
LILLFRMFFTSAILASFANAQVSTSYSTLVTLAILLQTSWFFTMTAFCMETLILNLWLKCIGVSIYYWFYCLLSFLVVFNICTIYTIAFWTTSLSIGKAVAIKLQTFRLFAVASAFSIGVFNNRQIYECNCFLNSWLIIL